MKILFVLFCSLFFTSTVEVVNNGPTNNRVNIIILGDGYS